MTVASALYIVRLTPQQSDDPYDKALGNSAKKKLNFSCECAGLCLNMHVKN